MQRIKDIILFVLIVMPTMIWGAVSLQDDNTRRRNTQNVAKKQIVIEEDTIPDSLLHPRWKIQRTMPIVVEDLSQGVLDLRRPDNVKQDVQYDDTLHTYKFGTKIGNTWVNAPVVMSLSEYMKWSEKKELNEFFRSKNKEVYQAKGKEKFDFTDMHFDLGPAEKIFGPGGIRVKTQGTAELKIGANLKNIDNPSLPIRNRKTTAIDFDEKININVNGKVGDKVNMNLNYNTDATFDFDSQNMKLKYEGKEDEIIKLVEAGNVSFPSNSSLISGSSALFGVRTDLQFGKLKLQTVVSQKKSNSKSVSSKGGSQLTPFEIDAANYEENRHFFLAEYFRNIYDDAMRRLPNLTTGIHINRVEIWVTNNSGQTANTRNIVALSDLAEGMPHNSYWTGTFANNVPYNAANSEYEQMVTTFSAARNIDETSSVLGGIPDFEGGSDYEKIEKARLLSPSEYTLNSALGYVSLRQTLNTDQVLAVAFEYTCGGVTYQVGELSSDVADVSKALFVKTLKNTACNPRQTTWKLMMKNAYYLASTVEKEKFRLDVKFQSDTVGVYINYIPEPQVKDTMLLKIIGADRLDNNNRPHSNGFFDFVDGYTVSNGSVFLPKVEPFGRGLKDYLVSHGVAESVADKYTFTELYDSTKTIARQIAEKDKFMLQGQFKGTSQNVISLNAENVPRGSVVVTAGGVKLTEGSDYIVDYSAGEVTIINQSIIDAGTSVNVSLESNTDYGQQRKTMLGLNWEYDFSKDFMLSGTIQHLSEQSQTTKVAMGAEPLKNTLWGVNLSWKKESQWLTNVLNAVPFLHVTQPSYIQFNAEFAHLIAGQAGGTQDNASYIDDFENTKNARGMSTPSSWIISSVPTMFPESSDKTTLSSGFNRSRLAWYYVDPIFTRRSSSLTPGHIKGDMEQLSNHYVREVYVKELYPNRGTNSYEENINTLSVLNLAYYPNERGPYNFSSDLNHDGTLVNPKRSWGGMMRKIDNSDFEASNIEYIEFWMLDPFVYTKRDGTASQHGGDLYFNLGEMSEDILRDGRKFYESGMPVDGSTSYAETQWGRIPVQNTITYGFATTDGSRALQDLGFNGLNDEDEYNFVPYQQFLNDVKAKVSQEVYDSIAMDPANDNYHYFRGSDWDAKKASILDRYKYINNPQGNSPDSNMRTENFDTSYKTTPDVEDINQDYTLNEYEKYYQYKVSIRPEDMVVGENFIVDKRIASVPLRNGNTEDVTWYQFRIPLKTPYKERIGNIADFTNIRFMRMFLTNFEKPIVLRLASLDLVMGEWRVYEQNLNPSSPNTAQMAVSAVNVEENNDKTPVNYVLPPGITREVDPSQPQLTEDNEQAMNFVINNMSTGDAKAVYKNTRIDMRQYRRLQMFVHANAFQPNSTNLQDDQLALFIRLGSDYKSNYYEYEIPLKLTPAGTYSLYSAADCRAVWPVENMLDIKLSLFTSLKKQRNIAKNSGYASYNVPFTSYDDNNPKNKITVMGNPSLGEVKTMVIGVRNLSSGMKSGEVWVNELRLRDAHSDGGWAAQGNLNVQLSDFGSVTASGKYVSEGFGGLEDGVASRSMDNFSTYSVTTNLNLGKFFPDKAKVSAPLYYSYTKERTAPKYNPLDTDMLLDDALDAEPDKHKRDSIESLAVTRNVSSNFSLSGVRFGIATKKHPMPYDPANFTFSYSHSHNHTDGETTVYENEDMWRGSLSYNWTPVFKPLEPFKNLKSKSKYYDIFKRMSINWLPQNISFNSDINRSYYELQERDMEDLGSTSSLPLTFSQQFLWNRDFSIRWDLTKNLHLDFRSATRAEIEEPYTPVNKDLYPEQYEAWKDSVWTSIKHMGTPLDYQQTFTASYKAPINLIPVFDWVTADGNYNSSYNWKRGTNLEDGKSLGNTIGMNRTLTINSAFDLEKLYNHVPFLKKVNDRFNRAVKRVDPKANKAKTDKKKSDADAKNDKSDKEDKNEKAKKELPKNSRAYEREITLQADTSAILIHSKKSRRLIVTARNAAGKIVPIKYKMLDANKIRVFNRTDSTMKLKISVVAKEPYDDKDWYRTTQSVARLLMMVRKLNFTYRDQYSLVLPGFMPSVGDIFGQKKISDAFSPGLDFAFGFTDDSYIDKANEKGWLLNDGTVATPATTSKTEDLQVRATLEPFRNFKIDVNASRTLTRQKSVQYMYQGNPTTQSGSFTMTTISIGSAFESIGDAKSGYHSATFERFCNSLETYRKQVESKYVNTVYPRGTQYEGKTFDPVNIAGVNKYSADVMVPAFLNTYTSSGGMSIFPVITRMLPNWTIRYSGLSNLTWFQDKFKSFNVNHSYKSVYAVGAYSSYSSFMSAMGDGLGFIIDATSGGDKPVPNSMYNVSQVSINESFSPLLGVDMTLHNNMTLKMEYRKTRVLNLSMTSIQLNETTSNDWVFGLGYKLNDFNFFGAKKSRIVKSKGKKNDDDKNKSNTSSKSSFNHDLNLRLDLSLRSQASLTRDIATLTSNASSGNSAFKLSFVADYTVSKLLSMSFYYDRQTNTPLLTTSSYPTTTQDFGLSMKFSLTR